MTESSFPTGIYGITAEKFSQGRDNVAVVKEMIDGGVAMIQYREKHDHKSFRAMYEECLAIRRLTRDIADIDSFDLRCVATRDDTIRFRILLARIADQHEFAVWKRFQDPANDGTLTRSTHQ